MRGVNEMGNNVKEKMADLKRRTDELGGRL